MMTWIISILILFLVVVIIVRKRMKNAPPKPKNPQSPTTPTGQKTPVVAVKKVKFWKRVNGLIGNIIWIVFLVSIFVIAGYITFTVSRNIISGIKKEFAPAVDKPKYRTEYVYEIDPALSRTVYFSNKYKEVIRIQSDDKLKIYFKNSTCSYCVRDRNTNAYNCGDASEDVVIPKSNNDKIDLMFKSRDGQKYGHINIEVKRRIPKRVRIN